MNLLFVCGGNRRRSPTAEHIFADWPDVSADSAGLNRDADTVLSADQIEWADVVFVMESGQRSKLTAKFGKILKNKKVVCLNIRDEFEFMAPELVELLRTRIGRQLRNRREGVVSEDAERQRTEHESKPDL